MGGRTNLVVIVGLELPKNTRKGALAGRGVHVQVVSRQRKLVQYSQHFPQYDGVLRASTAAQRALQLVEDAAPAELLLRAATAPAGPLPLSR